MVQVDLQNTMAARTLLIRESKSKAKECKLVSLRTLKGHPTADLDHASHRDIYPYHNLLMRVMSTVTGKMADSVPSGFLLISHKLLPHFAWILVGIQIHKSSNYWPNFSSNRHHLAIQTIHLPKLLCSEMAANRADKISLKSDVLLNQYSSQLKTLKGPKQGMRSPSLGSIQLRLSH